MVEDSKTKILAKLSGCTTVKVEPVGRWFEAFGLRRLHKQTLSAHSTHSSSSEESAADISEDEGDEVFLRSLDPRDWKNQDHYEVLGLAKHRYNATDEQIKKAYKKKVLKHHPDKRKARGLDVKEGEDDYFSCITMAYDVLGIPSKRKAYDSVDSVFDDDVPSLNQHNKDNFFKIFQPVFESNSRWSTKKRIPPIGSMDSSYEDVNKFYNFWYEFNSWREYSYLDEEEKEKGENRDERRWIEKQNKAERQKRKKEEVARIRLLVDNAYACDPRIQKFKDEEKQKKLAQKRAKQEAGRQKFEEEEKVRKEAAEEERKKKEKEEEEAKAQAAIVKKEKEAHRKALKNEKALFMSTMQGFNYFSIDEDHRVSQMTDVDKLTELLSLASLQSLNEDLASGDIEKAKRAYKFHLDEMNVRLAKEKQELMEKYHKTGSASSSSSTNSSGSKTWTQEETQMLIKGVNLFPAGTVQRWETVANFINQHCGSSFNAKETLSKAKTLQRMDPGMKKEANKKAFDYFAKGQRDEKSAQTQESISKRYDSIAEQQIAETGTNPAPWQSDEQKLLEQALKTYPANTPERWERISETVPSRSKKDCMKRYKELVELVRAKKAAQAATTKAATKST